MAAVRIREGIRSFDGSIGSLDGSIRLLDGSSRLFDCSIGLLESLDGSIRLLDASLTRGLFWLIVATSSNRWLHQRSADLYVGREAGDVQPKGFHAVVVRHCEDNLPERYVSLQARQSLDVAGEL